MTTPSNNEVNTQRFDDDLDFTQNMRKRLVHSIVKDEKMPEDRDNQEVLLASLRDMDKNSMDRKKIIKEDDHQSMAADMVAGFLSTLHQSAHKDPLRVAKPEVREIKPDLSQHDNDVQFNEFMLSQEHNHGKTDIDSFTDRFLEEHPEYRD